MTALERQLVMYGLLLLLVAGGVAGAYFKGRNDAGDEWEQKVAVLEANATAQEGVVMQLRQANARWASENKADVEAAEGAIKRAERAAQRVLAENTRLKRELEDVYRENPESAAWADAPIPAAVLERLRSQ